MQVIEPIRTYTDTELLENFAAGDERAFTEMYNRYFGLLYVHAHRILGNDDEAKDAVQDVFSSLWNRRETFNISVSLSSYLYTAVRNKVFDILQHRKVESRYTESLKAFVDAGYLLTDHRIRERQLQVQIEKEVAALPPKMRMIFEMSRNKHYSHREIAHELDLSEHTVRTQVKNAIRILKVKLTAILSLLLFFI